MRGGFDAVWFSEAAKVRSKDAKACLGKRRNLIAPQVAGVGKAVEQKNRHALAVVDNRKRQVPHLHRPGMRRDIQRGGRLRVLSNGDGRCHRHEDKGRAHRTPEESAKTPERLRRV